MGPPKRLLLVTQSLAMGGVETMVCDLVRLLGSTEFVPEVAVLESGGALEAGLREKGTPVHDLGKRPGLDLAVASRLRRLVRERSLAVIHTHNFAPWFYTSIAAIGAPTVRHVHTQHSEVQPSVVRHFLTRRCAPRTDEVVAVSTAVQRCLSEQAGVERSAVRVIPNGIDTRRFRPDPAGRATMRHALGIEDHAVVIGVIARLVPLKGHRDLLDALAMARRAARVPLRLLVVGDGPARTALEAHAAQLGLGDVVTFLGERRDTDALLAAMDVYALPSLSEGMNLTLLEATAAGLPIVATNVGGNPEIVTEGTTGYLVPMADPGRLADALVTLAHDDEARTRFGAAGRLRALHCFDELTMFAGYLSAYRGAAHPATALAGQGAG